MPLSDLEKIILIACFEGFWLIRDWLDAALSEIPKVGRPRECGAAEFLAIWASVFVFGSMRSADRNLRDPRIWSWIVENVEAAWLDDPRRRLGGRPPTRHQFMRVRKQVFEMQPTNVDDLRAMMTDFAIDVARHLGCGEAKDSLTHPSCSNIIYGDATWEPSLYNSMGPKMTVDPDTGEIFRSRVDPDARSFHKESQSAGNYIVSALMRTEHPLERVILDAQYKPEGISDGTVFTDMFLEVDARFTRVRGGLYDMALGATDQDRILETGKHAICKVSRTKDNGLKRGTFGKLNFTAKTRTFQQEVVVIDGCPVIIVNNGEDIVVPLRRKQTKKRDSTLYNIYEIPDDPVVPVSKRLATVTIRIPSTEEEISLDRRRTQYFRSISPNDPDFARLFGRREDSESMHHQYKSRLVNRRAGSVGLIRREVMFRSFQLLTMVIALAAHTTRTGVDTSRFLGRWDPPDRVQRLKAA